MQEASDKNYQLLVNISYKKLYVATFIIAA